jgi:hypothetical protein
MKNVLTSIKYEDIVDDSFLAITFSTSKNNQILAKLSRRVAVPSRRRLTDRLTWINL